MSDEPSPRAGHWEELESWPGPSPARAALLELRERTEILAAAVERLQGGGDSAPAAEPPSFAVCRTLQAHYRAELARLDLLQLRGDLALATEPTADAVTTLAHVIYQVDGSTPDGPPAALRKAKAILTHPLARDLFHQPAPAPEWPVLPEVPPTDCPPSSLDRREIASWYHGHGCAWQLARATLASMNPARQQEAQNNG